MRETPRAKQAWADYVALGAERSLDKLAELYQSRTKLGLNSDLSGVPTSQVSRLKYWSVQFGWQARLAALADAEATAAAEREAAYRRSIFEEGFGLAHERVRALKVLAEKLSDELADDSKLWVRDYKLLGLSVREIARFNTGEVEQFRGLLDDIAKEKSERKEIKVVQGDKNAPIVVRTIEVLLEPEPRDPTAPDSESDPEALVG